MNDETRPRLPPTDPQHVTPAMVDAGLAAYWTHRKDESAVHLQHHAPRGMIHDIIAAALGAQARAR